MTPLRRLPLSPARTSLDSSCLPSPFSLLKSFGCVLAFKVPYAGVACCFPAYSYPLTTLASCPILVSYAPIGNPYSVAATHFAQGTLWLLPRRAMNQVGQLFVTGWHHTKCNHRLPNSAGRRVDRSWQSCTKDPNFVILRHLWQ